MKKLIAFALASILTLGLTACGGGASSTGSSAAASNAASSSTGSSAAASTAASASTATSAADSTDASATSGESATPTLDAIKEKGTFTLMTATGFPPFEYLGADGQPAGVDIDVGQLVADELGVEYEVLDMDFGLLIEALKSGKGDMIGAGMTVTDERAQQVDFTVTYATAGQVLLLPADSTITSAEELKSGDCTVTVQANTTGDIYVQDTLGISSPLQFKNAVECAAALAAGKADAAVIDSVAANTIVKNYEGELKVLDEMVTEENYALAIAKGQEDLVEFVNQVIEKNIENGTIDKLLEEHTALSSEG